MCMLVGKRVVQIKTGLPIGACCPSFSMVRKPCGSIIGDVPMEDAPVR